jgi:hypothetical protein
LHFQTPMVPECGVFLHQGAECEQCARSREFIADQRMFQISNANISRSMLTL